MNFTRTFCNLLAVSALLFGCTTSKQTSDPLAGWQRDFNEKPSQITVDDCLKYLQKLPPEEKKNSGVSEWLKDGTGQHAFVIEVDLNGTSWNHLLIYGKDNKRIKAMKYVSFHYPS